MRGLVGGWLKSSQSHLLTMAAATVQSILNLPGSKVRTSWGCPARGGWGRRGAGGAGGRDECNIGGEKNNTAPRPVPPARPGPGIPLPTA